MLDTVLAYENALAETHPALDRAVALAEGTDVELNIIDVVAAGVIVMRTVCKVGVGGLMIGNTTD